MKPKISNDEINRTLHKWAFPDQPPSGFPDYCTSLDYQVFDLWPRVADTEHFGRAGDYVFVIYPAIGKKSLGPCEGKGETLALASARAFYSLAKGENP